MHEQLNGKRALVCGASQGIGAAIAVALAEQGCAITALARTQSKLEALVAGLPGGGHRVVCHDISDLNALKETIAQELADHGDIHILINNSGGPAPGPISQASPEAFTAGLQNHILAAACLTQLLLPGMKKAAYGRIINIISTSVKIPIPNLGVSNTIRGAMASWAKTLSLEVAADGITVNNILPGFTQTPRLDKLISAAAERLGKTEEEVAQLWRERVPARRFGDPKETAAAAAFLASPAAGYINGVNLPVDGGRTGCL